MQPRGGTVTERDAVAVDGDVIDHHGDPKIVASRIVYRWGWSLLAANMAAEYMARAKAPNPSVLFITGFQCRTQQNHLFLSVPGLLDAVMTGLIRHERGKYVEGT